MCLEKEEHCGVWDLIYSHFGPPEKAGTWFSPRATGEDIPPCLNDKERDVRG